MKHYLSVFKEFVRTSAAQQMSFRLHFFLVVIMEIIFYATGLFTIEFIFDHTQYIGPWDRNTFMFFASFLFVVSNLQMILLSHNFWQFSDDLKTGSFDFILLKPLSSIFTVFFRFFRFSTVTTIPITAGLLIYFGIQLKLSIASWCLLPILVVLGFIVQSQLEFIISSFMFWTTQGNGINFLRMQMHEIQSQPEFIYNPYFRRFMTYLFPMAFVGSLPVQYILDLTKYHLLVGLILAIIGSNLFLRFIWKRGLIQYESASS